MSWETIEITHSLWLPRQILAEDPGGKGNGIGELKKQSRYHDERERAGARLGSGSSQRLP